MVRGEDRLQASGDKGESDPVLVTPVRDVAGRFWRLVGCEGSQGAGPELRRHGLGQGPAFGEVKPHLPQGLGGIQFATRSGHALLEKGGRGWAPQGGNLKLGDKSWAGNLGAAA